MANFAGVHRKIFEHSTQGISRRFAFIGLIMALVIIPISLEVLRYTWEQFQMREKSDKEWIKVVSKKVSPLNALSAVNKKLETGFSENEIRELKNRAEVLAVEPFISNQFDFYTDLNKRLNLSIDLFFEAVPDELLDTVPEQWKWHEGQEEIPIMASRDFLDIYNFNITVLYGLPQLSPELATSFQLELDIWGKGEKERFKARIVGFTNRYNTLLVPYEFLIWANNRFGTPPPRPKKLVVMARSNEWGVLNDFIDSRNWQLGGELDIRKGTQQLIASIMIAMFFMGSLLALLSIALIRQIVINSIYQSQDAIHVMRLLGYFDRSIASRLMVLVRLRMIQISVIASLIFILVYIGISYWTSLKGWDFGPWIPYTGLLGVVLIISGFLFWVKKAIDQTLKRVDLRKQLGTT